MKVFIKIFVAVHVFLYRLVKGRGKFGGSPIGIPALLLTTTGCKSGKRRTVPLAYIVDENGYLVIASNGGQTHNPAWYANLKANPQATIELKDQTFQVRAEEISPEQYAQVWGRVIAEYPIFIKFEKEASRKIPMLHLERI
jgi:deazaflavin-dependent oxidoreductase (nitroreductase family)